MLTTSRDPAVRPSPRRWRNLALGLPAVAAILGISVAANAAEWWLTGLGERADTFVDRASIGPAKVRGKSWVSAWEWRLYRNAPDTKAKSSKTLVYYDCAKTADTIKSSTQYGATGDVIGFQITDDRKLEWLVEPAGTVGFASLNFVCDSPLVQPKATRFVSNGNEYLRIVDPATLRSDMKKTAK